MSNASNYIAWCDIYRNQKLLLKRTTLVAEPVAACDDEEAWDKILAKWYHHIEVRSAEECWVAFSCEQIDEYSLELKFVEPTYETEIVEYYAFIELEELND